MFHLPFSLKPVLVAKNESKQVNMIVKLTYMPFAMVTRINVNRPLTSVSFICRKSSRQIFFIICMQQACNDAHKLILF